MNTIQWRTAVWLAGFFVLAILQGYQLGIGDLSTYLAFVWHKFDPALLNNDLLIETLGDHPVYIWDAVALLLNIADVQTVFLGLFFTQTALMIAAIFLFYRRFFGENNGWLIVLLTLVLGTSAAAMGEYGLNPYGYFHPNVVAVAIALLAFVLLDRGNWLSGAALCGSVFLFHPFTALYAALFFGYKWLLGFRQTTVFTKIGSAAIFLLISAPSWLPMLPKILASAPPQFDVSLWLDLVRQRMRFSFFASQWVPDRWVHLSLAGFGLWFFRHHPAFWRLLPIVLGTVTSLLLFILADVFTIKFLLQLQLARCSYFLFIILCAFIAHKIATTNDSPKSPLIIWLLLGIVFMIEDVVDDRTLDVRLMVLAGLALLLVYLFWRQPAQWRRIYLAGTLAAVLLVTGEKTVERIAETGRIFDTTLTTPWEDMQVWCAQNTPEAATLMTPFYIEGFRSFSKRPIYGTYKDGAPHNYSRKTIFRWWARMQALGVSLPWNRAAFPALYHQHALPVARENNIRYVIYEKNIALPPVAPLYENQQFAIFEIPALPDSSATN